MNTFKLKGNFLGVFGKPYDAFENKPAGVSIKVNVMVGSAIFTCKADPVILEKFKDQKDPMAGELEFSISAFNMREALTLLSFEPK